MSQETLIHTALNSQSSEEKHSKSLICAVEVRQSQHAIVEEEVRHSIHCHQLQRHGALCRSSLSLDRRGTCSVGGSFIDIVNDSGDFLDRDDRPSRTIEFLLDQISAYSSSLSIRYLPPCF